MSEKKHIVVGIAGGIAVYKVAQLVSNLAKKHEVQVVMTAHAMELMSPLTFETLTGRPVVSRMFGPDIKHTEVPHIDLAKWADLIIITPATANIIAKMAHGLADDMLSTMMLAARCPVLVCPAMNTYMLDHPATTANLRTLQGRGIEVMESESGLLACKDFGSGKLPTPEAMQQRAEAILARLGRQDLLGLRITVTAGPTQEALDPVRFISNHSSGRMGYALAEAAWARGAAVTLISGPVNLAPPAGVAVQPVVSAADMFIAVQETLADTDILIKAAAVGDYRPAAVSEEKIKKGDGELVLRLVKNPDILAWAGEHKALGTVLCGFAMETESLLANARKKLSAKQADLLVANSLREEGAGFGVTTNIATLLWPDREEALPLMTKAELADHILDACLAIHKEKNHVDDN